MRNFVPELLVTSLPLMVHATMLVICFDFVFLPSGCITHSGLSLLLASSRLSIPIDVDVFSTWFAFYSNVTELTQLLNKGEVYLSVFSTDWPQSVGGLRGQFSSGSGGSRSGSGFAIVPPDIALTAGVGA